MGGVPPLTRRPTRFGPPGVRDMAHGAEKFLRRALGRAYVLRKYFEDSTKKT